ncbi:MAG TPA: hypothetical protein VG758_03840 [Hyphomicrobiaceae bacterium]|nr:hypothetical protein [Hyphomicrobiaceae bacterium]
MTGPVSICGPVLRLLCMNTLLVTTQIVAYGVGIVSASLNIAVFMRRHRARCRRLHAVRPRAQ